MSIYYIVHPDEDIYNVWNHKLGCFATDIDSVYDGKEFGYKNFRYAQSRAIRIMHQHGMQSIKILDRERLFAKLGLYDWSLGH